MRVRNKELRNRWKRKKDRIKVLVKEAIAGGKPAKAAKATKAAAPKPAPVKKEVKPKAEAAAKKPARAKKVVEAAAEAPAE